MWLALDDIQSRGRDDAVIQGLLQGIEVHEAAATGVHEHAAASHPLEAARSEQVVGVRGQGQMEADDVAGELRDRT